MSSRRGAVSAPFAALDGAGFCAKLPFMAILKIAKMGHPVLRGVANPIADPTHPRVLNLIRDMVETMVDANGAGLAAPQVHRPARLVIFQAPPERSTGPVDGEDAFDHTAPLTVLINPEIEFLTEERELGMEGCLSVPGLRGMVPRCTHIRDAGLNEKGERIEREARGFHARVVQHEVDHLDGILYPQRMEDLSQLMFESELRHYVEAENDESAEAAE
jgi:peptide deformylase